MDNLIILIVVAVAAIGLTAYYTHFHKSTPSSPSSSCPSCASCPSYPECSVECPECEDKCPYKDDKILSLERELTDKSRRLEEALRNPSCPSCPSCPECPDCTDCTVADRLNKARINDLIIERDDLRESLKRLTEKSASGQTTNINRIRQLERQMEESQRRHQADIQETIQTYTIKLQESARHCTQRIDTERSVERANCRKEIDMLSRKDYTDLLNEQRKVEMYKNKFDILQSEKDVCIDDLTDERRRGQICAKERDTFRLDYKGCRNDAARCMSERNLYKEERDKCYQKRNDRGTERNDKGNDTRDIRNNNIPKAIIPYMYLS